MSSKCLPRQFAEGEIPFLNVEGTAFEAGRMLGYAWAEALRLAAASTPDDAVAWWQDRRFEPLIERYAPHLPDLFRGMAKGAGLPENKVSHPAPPERGGCTSFAIQPSATLDGIPISGQTKDTGLNRWCQFQVLRMKLTDGPSMLTLTYQGWPFGHGFARGGCSIFRNSLFVEGATDGLLPYSVWGLLAQCCPTVEDVVELTRKHGVKGSGHCTVADEQGGVVGLERGRGGLTVLKPKHGIYTHANAVVGSKHMMKYQTVSTVFQRDNSIHRETRLRERLEADHGRLTAQLALMAMADHTQYPTSICRHEGEHALTTSAVVVEPTRGLLHATRGNPCQNWPVTYRL